MTNKTVDQAVAEEAKTEEFIVELNELTKKYGRTLNPSIQVGIAKVEEKD